jgi:hypothetical protein
VDDDLVALLVDPRGVAADDHRQLLLLDPDPAQGPQVVVVQAGGLDLHGRPPLGDLRLGPLAHHQAAQRIVGRERLGVHGEHGSEAIDCRTRSLSRPTWGGLEAHVASSR